MFHLPRVAAFTELPLQHHLPGNTSHLTVVHRVCSTLLFRSNHAARLVLFVCKEERRPPVTRVLSLQTWGVWNDFASILRTATRAVARGGSYAPSVVIMGGDERTGRWNCCHFLWPFLQKRSKMEDGKPFCLVMLQNNKGLRMRVGWQRSVNNTKGLLLPICGYILWKDPSRSLWCR